MHFLDPVSCNPLEREPTFLTWNERIVLVKKLQSHLDWKANHITKIKQEILVWQGEGLKNVVEHGTPAGQRKYNYIKTLTSKVTNLYAKVTNLYATQLNFILKVLKIIAKNKVIQLTGSHFEPLGVEIGLPSGTDATKGLGCQVGAARPHVVNQRLIGLPVGNRSFGFRPLDFGEVVAVNLLIRYIGQCMSRFTTIKFKFMKVFTKFMRKKEHAPFVFPGPSEAGQKFLMFRSSDGDATSNVNHRFAFLFLI